MADTVGEAIVDIRVNSSGMRRGVEKALADAARDADDAGKKAGENFVDEFGKSIGRRAEQEDFGDPLGKRFEDSWKRTLGTMKDDWHTFKDAFDRSRMDTKGGLLGDTDNEFRRTSVRMKGFLGEFQHFGNLIRTGAIDLRNWRAGLAAVSDTILGLGKSVYKAALALGPMAGGLSSLAGIATAFSGSVMIGLIGGMAAIGPLAIAAGAAFAVLSVGMKAFGKHATEAQKKAVKPIKDQFAALSKVIQGNLFANISTQAKQLTPIMNTLKTAMGGVATAVSNTATGLLAVVGPGGQAHGAFTTLLSALAPLTQKLGQVVINLGSGLVGALGAAVPIATRFANSLINLTSRFAAFANSTKGRATLSEYFNRGYTAASKIMRILGTLGTALFKVLDLGDKAAGESFLDSMLTSVQKFNSYVSSAKGIQDLKRWFQDALYAAHSLAGAFTALGAAFGNLDTGQTRNQFREIVDLAAQLITGFAGIVTKVQGMTSPFSTLGSSASGAWSAIKTLASTVANLFNVISESGAETVLSTAFNLLATAAGPVNSILGAITPLVKTLADAFSQLPGPIQASVAALLLLGKTGMISGITNAVTGVEKLGVAATATAVKTSALSKIGSIGGKLAGAFGPVGLAIAGVSIGMGLLASHQQKAAKAAAEHKANVDALTQSMIAAKDVTGASVTASTSKLLADKNLFDIGKKLGVSEKDILSATQANTQARGALAIKSQQANEKLIAYRQAITGGTGAMKDGTRVTDTMVNKQQKVVDSYAKLGSGMQEINKSLGDASAKWLAQQQAMDAMQSATSAANPLIMDLTKQMQTFADSTQTATSRTDAFASALNELTDRSMGTQEAAIKQADAQRQLQSMFGKTKDAAGKVSYAQDNIKKAFQGSTTQFDLQNKATSDLFQNMQGNIVPAMAKVVDAAFQAAGGTKNLDAATIAASNAAGKFDTALTKQFEKLGLTKDQAQSVIDKFHLMPTDVKTLSSLIGGKATEAQMQAILDRAKQIKATPIELKANAEAAVKTAADLQTKIDKIRQGAVPGLNANSAKGKAVIADMQAKITAIRQRTATALAANPAAAKATIASLQKQLDGILQRHPTALKADKNPAHATAVALQGEISSMKATMSVHADMGPANATVDGWQPPSKTMQVYTKISQSYAAGKMYAKPKMTGGIIDSPTVTMLGERGYREAVVPLDLPLNRVSPEVRQMSALLRGGAGAKTNVNSVPAQKVQNVTLNITPMAANPEAVASSFLNRLAAMGR